MTPVSIARNERRQLRIEWMKANRGYWEEWESLPIEDVEGRYAMRRAITKACAVGMKEAGLVAKSTYYLDVGIPKLIEIIQRQEAKETK